jgi:hypothetical protein
MQLREQPGLFQTEAFDTFTGIQPTIPVDLDKTKSKISVQLPLCQPTPEAPASGNTKCNCPA